MNRNKIPHKNERNRKKRTAGMPGSLVLALLLAVISVLPAQAEETKPSSRFERGEVVFLLDTSVSMNTQDKRREAIDAIRQMAYGLPSGDKVGLVAYNTGIQTTAALDSDRETLEEALASVEYTGYTNAGEGLWQAVKLFSDDESPKYIVMLSDGEIDMPDSQAKEQSRARYVEAARQAKEKGIGIYIMAIGSEIDEQMHIFDGAEITDGAIYWEGQNGTLSQIADRIMKERMGLSGNPLGTTDSGGGSVHADLPENAGRVRILLTADGGLGEVTADYAAESGRIISGKNFAVIDMTRPSSEKADIYVQTEDIAGVKARLFAEYTAKPEVAVEYRIEEQPQTPPSYKHYADVRITLRDTGGDQENLWEKAEGETVSYTLNGVSYTGTVEQGTVGCTIPADGIDSVEVSVELEKPEAIYYIEQPVTAQIEKYPDPVPEPEPDYGPLFAVLAILGLSILVLVIWWMRKSRTTIIYMASTPKEPERKLETRNCTYSGKFGMYVIRNQDGRDIPPQTYILFGKAPGRMTLDKILSSCGIKLGKVGAEDIIFYPGPDHSVIMMDQSERCTVMRGSEILKKGMGYPVFYGEKITVTFEDDTAEMEIHYKNLKPSEREGKKGRE